MPALLKSFAPRYRLLALLLTLAPALSPAAVWKPSEPRSLDGCVMIGFGPDDSIPGDRSFATLAETLAAVAADDMICALGLTYALRENERGVQTDIHAFFEREFPAEYPLLTRPGVLPPEWREPQLRTRLRDAMLASTLFAEMRPILAEHCLVIADIEFEKAQALPGEPRQFMAFVDVRLQPCALTAGSPEQLPAARDRRYPYDLDRPQTQTEALWSVLMRIAGDSPLAPRDLESVGGFSGAEAAALANHAVAARDRGQAFVQAITGALCAERAALSARPALADRLARIERDERALQATVVAELGDLLSAEAMEQLLRRTPVTTVGSIDWPLFVAEVDPADYLNSVCGLPAAATGTAP